MFSAMKIHWTCLLFGSAAAVMAFGRIGRALRFLFVVAIGVPCGNIVDDCPVVEPNCTINDSCVVGMCGCRGRCC